MRVARAHLSHAEVRLVVQRRGQRQGARRCGGVGPARTGEDAKAARDVRDVAVAVASVVAAEVPGLGLGSGRARAEKSGEGWGLG